MIRRCPRPTGNFCVINNEVINDQRLSWDTRGTLLYLLSKPDHWTVSVANLVNQTVHAIRLPSGRDAVYAMLRELMIARYVKRVQLRGEDGTMAGVEYVVSELPFEDAEVGDDFLLKRRGGQRRPSRATRSRSFSSATGSADAPTPDSGWAPVDVTPVRIRLVGDADEAQATQALVPASLAGPEPIETSAGEVGGEAPVIRTASEQAPTLGEPCRRSVEDPVTMLGSTAGPSDKFSPLTAQPEAAQPGPANTTQVKTHLKKRRMGSKDPVAPAARARAGKPQPRRRAMGQSPEIALFNADTLTARGVDAEVAATWLAVRARKRAVNSMLALDGVQEQATLAGLSLGDAIKIAAVSSWQGFRADWVKRNDGPTDKGPRRPPRSGAQMTEDELAESIRKAKEELFAEEFDDGNWREPTLLDRDGDMWRAPS